MKTILCFGDSLTYGTKPDGTGRHAHEDRWPTVLGEGLGHDRVRIIAEGLGGRTTSFDDFSALADRNGTRLLPTLLASHNPLDAVVIMLGTNDLKTYLNGSALAAAMGMKRLVEIIRTFPYDVDAGVPKIVLVSPPFCVPTEHADLSPMFEHGLTECREMAPHYRRIASELECAFFDAATVATASSLDGVHLDAANSRAIGTALAPVVRDVLGL